MKTKKKILKICSIALVALLVLLSLSSCKKKDNETKAVANPSALVNKDAVVQSDNSSNSIVTVPVPVNVVEEKTSISSEVVASTEKETDKVEVVGNTIPLNNLMIEALPDIIYTSLSVRLVYSNIFSFHWYNQSIVDVIIADLIW